MAETATGTYFIIPTGMGIGYLPFFRPVDEPSCFKIFRLIDANTPDVPKPMEQAKALVARHRHGEDRG